MALQKAEMKKKFKWYMFLAVILLLSACGKSVEQQITEQLELGQKYLAEVQYEEALVAFQKVIELEPKTYEAYMGIAQVYEGQERYEAMQEILEVGIEAIGVKELNEGETQQIVESYMRLTEYFMAEGEYEAGLNCYEQILVLQPENEGIREKEKTTRIFAENKEKIEESARLMLAEEPDNFEEIDRLNSELKELTKDLEEPIIFATEDERYIVVYPSWGCSIYYGEMKEEKRHGHGYLFFGSIDSCSIYEGIWKEDVGDGKFVREFYNNSLTNSRRSFYGHSEGEVVSGLYEGSWTHTQIKDGHEHEFHVTYRRGKAEALKENDDGTFVVGYCVCGRKMISTNNIMSKIP